MEKDAAMKEFHLKKMRPFELVFASYLVYRRN